MPWITVTEDHLLRVISSGELEALRSKATAPGQDDPVTAVIASTCLEVQGYVGARYPVGQAGTVPEQLLNATVAIARWRLLTRLPVKLMATEARRQEYDDAISLLKDVAAGKFALSVASEPAEEQPRPQADGAWGGTKDF